MCVCVCVCVCVCEIERESERGLQRSRQNSFIKFFSSSIFFSIYNSWAWVKLKEHCQEMWHPASEGFYWGNFRANSCELNFSRTKFFRDLSLVF